MGRKVIVTWVSLAMLVSFIVIIVEIAPVVEAPTIIYVDDVAGSGSGNPAENFTNIQDAINASSDRDTVFVYNGTYYENVIVNKTINLTGENRDTTIIDGGGSGDVVKVIANWVNITEFLVTGGGSGQNDAGIELYHVQNCTVINNNVSSNNRSGIFSFYSDNNIIIGNNAFDNRDGINLEFSFGNNASFNNLFFNSWAGVYLFGSDKNNVLNNNALKNTWGIYHLSSHEINISGNNASYNYIGIQVSLSSRNNITDNIINWNDDDGIRIDESHRNNISDNSLIKNKGNGILFTDAHNNKFTSNVVINNIQGIFLYYSNMNNISDNIINYNNLSGIWLRHSSFDNVHNNTMVECGIFIDGMFLEHWNSHYVDILNTVNGKPVYYYKNQTEIPIPPNAGQVILANCTNMTIKYQSYTNTSVGIDIGFSSNISVVGNNLSSNTMYGIFACATNNSNFIGNIMNSNEFSGMYIADSYQNNFLYNNISLNGGEGMCIHDGIDNTISGNSFLFNYWGLHLYGLSDTHIHKNIISYNDLGVRCGGSYECDFTFNEISLNNEHGLRLINSNENKISYNNIYSNGDFGLYIDNSDGNIISRNSLNKNIQYNLYVYSSDDNLIYHNNFIKNANQAIDSVSNSRWNASYPAGGNYWSDYSGVDNFKGPDQDILGADGIGDLVYTLDASTYDHYPLMQLIENYSLLQKGWNLISLPLIQENTNLQKVLEMIDGYYDAVQYFDITDSHKPWKHHKVGKSLGNDLFKLNESMGFWIHVTQPGETILLYNGTQATENQTIPLHKGWNQVGYPSLTSYNRPEGLNNLTFDTHINAIWTYNAATQKYKQLTELDYFEIGKGYYIHAKEDCTWEIPL